MTTKKSEEKKINRKIIVAYFLALLGIVFIGIATPISCMIFGMNENLLLMFAAFGIVSGILALAILFTTNGEKLKSDVK